MRHLRNPSGVAGVGPYPASRWFLRRQALRTSSSSVVPLACHSQGPTGLKRTPTDNTTAASTCAVPCLPRGDLSNLALGAGSRFVQATIGVASAERTEPSSRGIKATMEAMSFWEANVPSYRVYFWRRPRRDACTEPDEKPRDGAPATHNPEVHAPYRGSSPSASCTLPGASSRLNAMPLRTARPSRAVIHLSYCMGSYSSGSTTVLFGDSKREGRIAAEAVMGRRTNGSSSTKDHDSGARWVTCFAAAIAATILALDVAIPYQQERQRRPKTDREPPSEDAD
jgi:hypothetical protein